MDEDMDATASYFDPEDLSSREQYRRYRKKQSTSNTSPLLKRSVSKFSDASLLYDGDDIQRRPNAALLLEEIKQEAEISDMEGLETTIRNDFGSSKRRASIDSLVISEQSDGLASLRETSSRLLKSRKNENEMSADGGDIFTLFASLLDSALQGLLTFPDLIQRFESTCRNVSESIRYGTSGRLRVVKDKFMQQHARVLLDEAASWSLLWYLFGKGIEDLPENLLLNPTTSHQLACQFVNADHTAQTCLRVVLWLEGLMSKALELEKKVRGSHVGSYLPSFGVWHRTQRLLKKNDAPATDQHLDFDAPTRQLAKLQSDDKKQDELLLEDIWSLLRAGRSEEACELCHSAGQPWRAATLCPFGGFDLFPSVETMHENGKARTLQAIELESGIGHQWRLWKWACYTASEKIAVQDGGRYEMAVYAAQCSNLKHLLPICTDWESACWAMAKSWLDFQVDQDLANFEQGNMEERAYGYGVGEASSTSAGPESWPCHVLHQQPHDLPSLLQKLHSGEMVHETVSRACKEQHRQIEMNLMVGDIAHLLDLLYSWISQGGDDSNVLRPQGDPQLLRFEAHLVLLLRYVVDDEVKDAFKEKLSVVGDRILLRYAMLLFSEQHEELVGLYASQLAQHLCVDLFVEMMELRLNHSMHVKYKLFRTAMEYLPFSSGGDSRACFEDIIERILFSSREIKTSKYDGKLSDVAEQHRLESLQKAMVVQWLCFTPPSTINNFETVKEKLLLRALLHCNTLFREFALISMWRVPKMPVGAHKLLGFLAEPLKLPEEALRSFDGDNATENLREFDDWREYYSCDATYRKWLQIETENAVVPRIELSMVEKGRAIAAAKETLNLSLSLLMREGCPWLNVSDCDLNNSTESVYLELHAISMLCLPSGECMCPDATTCTALTSALYSSVSEEDVLKRQLMVNVSVSSKDNYCIEVVLRCLAVNGDGLGTHDGNDGGLLASVMASGFKGELNRFQAGVTMEISRLDAWYSDSDGLFGNPATYIVKGLCRRCCLPEVILRCMQISSMLAESGDPIDLRNELIELVASPQSGMLQLFSQHQLQEFLLFERDCSLYNMEFQQELPTVDT